MCTTFPAFSTESVFDVPLQSAKIVFFNYNVFIKFLARGLHYNSYTGVLLSNRVGNPSLIIVDGLTRERGLIGGPLVDMLGGSEHRVCQTLLCTVPARLG